jgi:hypothetical protein
MCRRGSLIQRARNRRRQSAGGCLAGHGGSRTPAAIGDATAKRPRRMGLCSEVADDGGNLEDHPALASRYVRPKAPFQRADRQLANRLANSSQAALNLFHSGSDKILAWDIASLGELACAAKRPYSACAAQCFSEGRGSGVRRGNSDAPAGLARGFCRAGRANVFAGKWNMELCSSAPVIAQECGRFP